MRTRTFVCFAVIITFISTLSFSQSTDSNAPKIKVKSCYEIMKNQTDNSEFVLSIGGGFTGLFNKYNRPNGFNIQTDIIYPVENYFALNIGLAFTQFPGYHYDDSKVYYNTAINDTVYSRFFGDYATISLIHITPGVSFGNINMNKKLNFYLTAGLTIGIDREGQGIHNITSTYTLENDSLTIKPSYRFKLGGFVSGRISYKVSQKLNIFIEPALLSEWSDNSFSNYHINGGVSIAL